MRVSPRDVRTTRFGRMPDGRAVEAHVLTNANGLAVTILAFGGIVQSLLAPDRNGAMSDIVLGYDALESYLTDPFHFGALIGRYAGRIGRGEVVIDGRAHKLARNEGPNTLHGGVGFSKALWNVGECGPGARVVLTHRSPDGDQGFPGTLDVEATYSLTDDDVLWLEFTATTTAATIVNLTNHSYWRLGGDNAVDHQLQIDADAFLEIDEQFLPTGKTIAVAGTPFDFRSATALSQPLRNTSYRQVALAGGIDHCFVLNEASDGLRPAATLSHPLSGRRLSVETSEPGLQVYSSNSMSTRGKGRAHYDRWTGIAFEAQHFPDSPRHPEFPSTILRPGETFRSCTRFKLAIQRA